MWMSSCSTPQELSIAEAKAITNYNAYVILQSPYKHFHLYDYSLTSDSLTGYLYPWQQSNGTFLTFYTKSPVYAKVNKRNHPYYSAHLNTIYKTEKREENDNTVDIVFCIIEFLLCYTFH